MRPLVALLPQLTTEGSIRLRSLASPAVCSSWHLSTVADSFEEWSASETDTQAAELDTLSAWPRSTSGRLTANKLRKNGLMPAIIFSLENNRSQLVSMKAGEVARQVQQYGRRSVVCKVFNIHLEDPALASGTRQTYRCLLRQVHINSVTDRVENVTLMHCPPDRLVRMEVPVSIIGDNVSPGVKRGGFANLTRRFIKMLCPADRIPSVMEVDVSNLDIGDRVMLTDLTFPEGVMLLEKDASQPVCKIAGKLRKDGPEPGQG